MDFKSATASIVLLIIENLDTQSLINLGQCCSKFRYIANDKELWRRRCLDEFPWFFWTGCCESTLSQSSGESKNQVDERSKWNTTRSPKCCQDCNTVSANPYHPLPKSWKQAYLLIFYGKYSGLIHVLNSLQNREMSAFMALATYDYESNKFILSYHNPIISRYRCGELIILRVRHNTKSHQASPPHWVSEQISLDERIRFRRIPASILKYDPREIFTSELFSMPVLADGRPLFLENEEVEIQWRSTPLNSYAWWRGFVVCTYTDLIFGIDEDYGTSAMQPNIPFDTGRTEGIQVIFPHYPVDSRWRNVVVSIRGIDVGNEIGFVGGIRRVACQSHSLQWENLYKDSIGSIIAQMIPMENTEE